MLWRHLCLVRAITAAGLLTFSTLSAQAAGEPQEPIPGADAPGETVKVLDAEKAGLLAVEVRGAGQDRVKVSIKNSSGKKLNVVLPPGLVASNATAQGGGPGGGGGGGGNGFQSMGLGSSTNKSGGFGQFAGSGSQTGFQSIAASEVKPAVSVLAGQSVDVEIPAVCLNFGLPTPTHRNKFRLVDVDDYTKDARVRKALRALATLGTSQGTAQAAMWRICNDVPFEMMLDQGGKVVNAAEVALASRFLEALDRSSETVDPAYLSDARLFVTIQGEGIVAKDAKRIAGSLEGLRVLGLPVHLVAPGEAPKTIAPALHLGITLSAGQSGETKGKVAVQATNGLGEASDWSGIGRVTFTASAASSSLDGASLARAIDHAVSSGFVSVKATKRTNGSTNLKIENKLPFSLSTLTVKTGGSSGSPTTTLSGLGVGPNRIGQLIVPAASASVDRVELNGL